MWSETTRWVAPRRRSTPVIVRVLVWRPSIWAPIAIEQPREIHHVGLARGVQDRRRSPRESRGHQDVLGRGDARFVEEDDGARQAALRHAEFELRLVDLGAELAQAVEMGVEAAASDAVAAGRVELRAAEAMEQRSDEQAARSGRARTARAAAACRAPPPRGW